jgi:SAM-dependent methyltransferase
MLGNAIRRASEIVRDNPWKLIYLFTPHGWRQFAALTRERQADTKAIVARKNEIHRVGFESDAWKHGGTVSSRTYVSREEYVAHQREKLDQKQGQTFLSREKAIRRFRRRFKLINGLPARASIVCLAARRGEEVEALIGLGHFAVGIDLNPGADNPYVVTGDFHALQFADGSVDCIYTNSLDHAFDLPQILGEVRRVLKPGGRFVVDIVYGHEEGYVVGDHDAMHWGRSEDFAKHLAATGGFRLETFRDLAAHGSEFWTQAIMRNDGK